jgi:uncharacterized protein (UPF0261 family)
LPEAIDNTEHIGPPFAKPGVLLVGTLDTKGAEIAYVADALKRLGCEPVVLDSGIRGEATWEGADYRREEVAAESGSTLEELRSLPRGDALGKMAEGVKAIATSLALSGRVEGALCVGGAGVSLVVPAFQALGHGFPKLLVTPLASGSRTFGAYIGTADVAVMHSVADIMGVNAVTEPVYVQAAGYIAGAVRARREARGRSDSDGQNVLVAATMNGNTTPALMHVKQRLAPSGIELVAFHANGVGGRAMEELAERGFFAGVLDFTTTELGGHFVGGLMDPGANRMEVAGRLGLPQVLVPGCLDLITTGTYDETQRDWPGRPLYRHNPVLTLVRLTRDEMAELGRKFAEKANTAKGPTHICIPLQGFSIPDHPDGPFWDPEADAAFVTTLEEAISDRVEVECIDAHVNDVVFADRVADVLVAFLAESGITVSTSLEMRQ